MPDEKEKKSNDLCEDCKYKRKINCPAKDNYSNVIIKGDVVSCNKFKLE